MSLSIGIVGLPNVGKSTLFQAITKKEVDRANYPFCTIDPNIGVVAVLDERIDKLAKLTNSAKKIYTTVEFVDIAGLVKGASKGEGLGNKFLANIKEVDAIVYVLRCFDNKKIVNTGSTMNVFEDKESLDLEMALKDLEAVEKRTQSLEKELRTGDKNIKYESEVLEKAKEYLMKGKILSELGWDEKERRVLKNYQFLTMKKRLFLLNGSDNEVSEDIKKTFKEKNWPFLIIDILTEFEASDFSVEERISFGLDKESELDALIKECYRLLGLITFLTTGPDETRGWVLGKGEKAPQAGGVIHSDFESNFIRAEVINWEDLINSGGFPGAREKGLIRTEGKDYVVQDGDVIEIKAGV
jgi:GTP-binding protein YchF